MSGQTNRFHVKLTNRRLNPHGPHANGSHICDVACPACPKVTTLTLGGWTAIVCGGCGAELYRSKNAPELQEGSP